MTKDKAFCKTCNNVIQYKTANKILSARYKDVDYSCKQKVAICPYCNSEVDIDAYRIENLKTLKKSLVAVEKCIQKDNETFPNSFGITK